jgi:hypothetical protein
MVGPNRICSECKSEMLLDKVVENSGEKTFWYTCVNPKCREYGKSYTDMGLEEATTIKNRE